MRFLGEAYLFLLFLIISASVTFVAYTEMGATSGAAVAVPFVAAGLIVPDFLGKLVMKQDETVMDHYLKSKPIPERSWNRFLLTTNLFSFWNWTIPVCLLPFCLLFLKWSEILPSFLLLLAVSMVGGVAITALRRAKGWSNKWPVFGGMLVWLIVAQMYALTCMLMPWWVSVTGFLLLCAGAIAMFYDYLCDLRRYDESQAKAGRLFLGASSLFSMEYISLLRSKRLRVSVLVLPLVFVFNTYTQLVNGLNVIFYSMLLFEIFSPSMMLGQWVFGIEGNYFDALWTKPLDIREILRNKFWFFAVLNAFATLLVVPVLWLSDLSPWLLGAAWLFTAGFANLTLMPTALISSRLELFQSAFFNYQGASLAINVYGLIVLVPIAIFCVCAWLLSPLVCSLVLAGIGLAGFALHWLVINMIADAYERRRYTCFERYRN
jgi:hypothetical protein